MKYFLVVCAESLTQLLFLLPRFRMLNGLKSLYLRQVWGAEIGRRVVYYSGVRIFTGRRLSVGDDVDFAKDVIVTTDGGVTIGDRVLIGYRTQILSTNHAVPALPGRIFDAGHQRKPVVVGDDVWIGANCVLVPGATIGSGAVIGAGSVVTGAVPANVYAAGSPARVIRQRV